MAMSAQEWPVIDAGLRAAGFDWSSTIIWAKDTLVLSRKVAHTQYEPIWYGWNDLAPRRFPLEEPEAIGTCGRSTAPESELHPTMKPVELIVRALENQQPGRRRRLRTLRGLGQHHHRGRENRAALLCCRVEPGLLCRQSSSAGRNSPAPRRCGCVGHSAFLTRQRGCECETAEANDDTNAASAARASARHNGLHRKVDRRGGPADPQRRHPLERLREPPGRGLAGNRLSMAQKGKADPDRIYGLFAAEVASAKGNRSMIHEPPSARTASRRARATPRSP